MKNLLLIVSVFSCLFLSRTHAIGEKVLLMSCDPLKEGYSGAFLDKKQKEDHENMRVRILSDDAGLHVEVKPHRLQGEPRKLRKCVGNRYKDLHCADSDRLEYENALLPSFKLEKVGVALIGTLSLPRRGSGTVEYHSQCYQSE